MREILFRGKLLATGEWAYGNLDIKPGGKVAVITPDDTPLGKYGMVDPATVGQYTGLTDKNGAKIFEGDILRWTGADGKIVAVAVFFSDGAYWCRRNTMLLATIPDPLDDLVRAGEIIEVIGNIYDNP